MQRQQEAVTTLSRIDDVVGVLLTGSRARAGMATSRSDVDLLAIVRDRLTHPLPSVDGIDIGIYTVAEVRKPELPSTDFDGWYNRYAFADARVLLDRTDGELARWVIAQSTLTHEEFLAVAPEQLDGYLNLTIRAAKSLRDQRPRSATLDLAESLPWALTTAFAMERRVRPFNKYLEWELAHRPLSNGEQEYGAALFLSLARADPSVSWRLAGRILRHAQARGFQDVLDSWGEDLRELTTLVEAAG